MSDEPKRVILGFCNDGMGCIGKRNKTSCCEINHSDGFIRYLQRGVTIGCTDYEEKVYKLFPCPFCGNEANIDNHGYMRIGYHGVYCGFCKSSTGEYKTVKEAVEAWNRRVI
jgi:Lar family restriction alleviation protein